MSAPFITDLLGRMDPDRVLWITDRTAVTAGTLCEAIAASGRKQLAGRRVAARIRDPLECAFFMVLAEGWAESILFLPSEAEESNVSTLLSAFDAEVVISDLTSPDLRSRGVAEPAPSPEVEQRTRWVIPTSGTTGTPKLVAHTLPSLTRTAKTDLNVGARHTWGLLYDLSRFAGLQVFLNSLLSGSRLILSPMEWPLEHRLALLVAHGCNSLSATPTMWRKIMTTRYASQFRFAQITLGGEIVDQPILDSLQYAYPAARISHIYASTEAGVGFSVNDGLAGFPKGMLQEPPAGMELRIDPEDFLLFRPRIKDQSYLGAGDTLFDENGWINTGDLVAVENDRILFRGRANGAINVGGNKVQPEEVERVIYSFPGVRMATVYGKKNAITGYLVAADIVADPFTDSKQWQRALTAHCRAQLADYKVPAIIRIVPELAVSNTGKVLRR